MIIDETTRKIIENLPEYQEILKMGFENIRTNRQAVTTFKIKALKSRQRYNNDDYKVSYQIYHGGKINCDNRPCVSFIPDTLEGWKNGLLKLLKRIKQNEEEQRLRELDIDSESLLHKAKHTELKKYKKAGFNISYINSDTEVGILLTLPHFVIIDSKNELFDLSNFFTMRLICTRNSWAQFNGYGYAKMNQNATIGVKGNAFLFYEDKAFIAETQEGWDKAADLLYKKWRSGYNELKRNECIVLLSHEEVHTRRGQILGKKFGF